MAPPVYERKDLPSITEQRDGSPPLPCPAGIRHRAIACVNRVLAESADNGTRTGFAVRTDIGHAQWRLP